MAINGIRPVTVKPQYMTPMLQLVKSKSEKALLELWQFVSCMPSNAENYFKNDNQVFEVRYLAVEPSHQNMGIASSLVTHSKKEAAANGLKYIRIDCTSHYTARIASTMGLDCIYQINYEDYRNPSGEHVFRDVTYPHTKILVYAGKTS